MKVTQRVLVVFIDGLSGRSYCNVNMDCAGCSHVDPELTTVVIFPSSVCVSGEWEGCVCVCKLNQSTSHFEVSFEDHSKLLSSFQTVSRAFSEETSKMILQTPSEPILKGFGRGGGHF